MTNPFDTYLANGRHVRFTWLGAADLTNADPSKHWQESGPRDGVIDLDDDGTFKVRKTTYGYEPGKYEPISVGIPGCNCRYLWPDEANPRGFKPCGE